MLFIIYSLQGSNLQILTIKHFQKSWIKVAGTCSSSASQNIGNYDCLLANCVLFFWTGLTVSNTQKCPSWLPPGAAWPQHGLLHQTCCFGYAAPELALADHQLWNGLKPSWQSWGEPAALKAAQALLCFIPRSNCCCPWCNGFFRATPHPSNSSRWMKANKPSWT